MELREAMQRARQAATRAGAPFVVRLCCGFTPANLPTFLAAHLADRTERPVSIVPGTYGVVLPEPAEAEGSDALVIVLEHAALDPRLGVRRVGGWTSQSLDDAVRMALDALDTLAGRLKALDHPRVVVLCPTLALPPLWPCGSWQAHGLALRLDSGIAAFAAEVAALPGVVVCDRDALTLPKSRRRNVSSEMAADFPYQTQHCDEVAGLLAANIKPHAALKGLVTDLDDTMWRGIVGDLGAANVTWTLDDRSQVHALYQQMLNALGERGCLIAIASKNEPAVVETTLGRSDLVLEPRHVHPHEVSWAPKSTAVDRILGQWNIGADAVAVVDDSPFELDEIAAAFPSIRTARFPRDDVEGAYALLARLRDLFHQERASAEDAIRLQSIKANAARAAAAVDAADPATFLRSIDARMAIEVIGGANEKRAVELINKTNQFNLNGRRTDEREMRDWLRRDGAVAWAVDYADKFGPLGIVSILLGRVDGRTLLVERWVLSCRAFQRHIEVATLRELFDSLPIADISFAVEATEKNAPVLRFLAGLTVEPGQPLLDRRTLAQASPADLGVVLSSRTRPLPAETLTESVR